jgi:hypothetical protein
METFILQITGHPQFGVPYGQDRIVPIFLATLAVRQKSQTIRFSSVSEMLETFGMQKVALSTVGWLPAFERISGATMFFGTESGTAKARVVQRSRFNAQLASVRTDIGYSSHRRQRCSAAEQDMRKREW